MSANNLSYSEFWIDAVNSRTSKQITSFFDELLGSSCVEWEKTLFISLKCDFESFVSAKNANANT